jgi:hypothetical protein
MLILTLTQTLTLKPTLTLTLITMKAPQWSETGDRYVLKLFRDYVFHQTHTDGAPALDAGHVVTALNKLDCGDPEQMLLSSRDNKDLLVVSFADVRRCLEAAFMDLDQQAEQAQQQKQQPGMNMGTQPAGQGQVRNDPCRFMYVDFYGLLLFLTVRTGSKEISSSS